MIMRKDLHQRDDIEKLYISSIYDIDNAVVGYSMSNPFCIYIKYMICKHILYITFLNKPELIFFAQKYIVSLISI